ncbi:MAG: hypothetical protein WA364_09370 [Candidatus Nitrosopolaris sp.]
MKLDLTLGIAITLVVILMNAPIVHIPIANADSNNFLISKKAPIML